jgi:hypothetical protein
VPSGMRSLFLRFLLLGALCCAPAQATWAEWAGEAQQDVFEQTDASDVGAIDDYIFRLESDGEADAPFQFARFHSPGEFREYELAIEAEQLTKALQKADPPEPESLEAAFDYYANRVIGWPYERLFASWVPLPLIRAATPARLEVGGNLKDGTARSWTGIFKSRWLRDEKWIYSRADFSARYTSVSSKRSENELIGTELLDLKSQNSPWVVFSKSYAEHDEIEKLAFRGTFALGPGYRWLDRKEFAVLVTRVGPAATYENFYDPKRSELKPEMVAEVEMRFVFGRATYEQLLTTYTNLQDADRFRSSAITDLLIPLDADRHWNWKTGFRHTYNGQPNAGVNHTEYEGTFSLVFVR